ncbi:hypothetical protein PHLCEN_2v12186 [Hermanssonia centrifuga]|uniref:Uncharacterized protein n=1 Tax=Hermanssonia centrifuga TaxID=98765 RepID=A0A2R6NHW1_9APHY|nr:hypothetical protein PHLCEN_2v12186 [Hermanssonia centrifuga]
MDFEELALKSLDPSLGPKLIHFSQPGANVKPEEHPTASAYLEKVLERGAIIPQASQELDSIYKTYAPPPLSSAEPTAGTKKEKPEDTDSDASSTPDVEDTPATDRHFILTRNAVPALAALSDLRPESSFSADVYRALEQARLRMESRKK